MDLFRLRTAYAGRDESSIYDAIHGALKGVFTALPAIIDQDSDGHIATAKSAVRMAVTQPDGSVKIVDFPLLDTSPVHFPGGGGATHTHPVKKGDEGVALFTSMPQDLWHQKGDVQDPIDARRHHLADSRWFPGGRSDPRKLNPPASTSSQQSRSDDGKHVWDMHPTNGLTAASTTKHLISVAGSQGSGTIHLPGKIIKNAAKVLINCIQQDPLPPPGASFANRKMIATTPVGATGSQSSGIAGVMSSVMSGGAAAIFSNPIGAQAGGLSSAITSAASAISGMGGVGGVSGLLSSLTGGGGLASALGGLNSGASAFSGATPPAMGAFGLSDLLSHAASLSSFFGSSPAPGSVSMSSALAPLQSGPLLDSLTAQLGALAASVVHGGTSPFEATATVNGWTAQVAALMAGANSAITTMNAAAPMLNLALAAAGAGAGMDPHEQAISGAISNPALAALTQMIGAAFSLSADDLAAAQAFPDAAAEQAGATGGM